MDSESIIREGDTVSVYWENVQNVFEAEVLFAPSAFGEPWMLKERNGTIHYVMAYSRMTMRKRAPIQNMKV